MPAPVLTRRSRSDAIVLIAWLAWCAWVLAQYFTIPSDPFSWREPGELFPPPYAREALMRSASGATAAMAVTLAGWAAGALLLRGARDLFASGVERAVFELAIGFGALSLTCLLLAFAGVYRPAVLVALTIGLATVGLALLAARRRWPELSGFAALRSRERVVVGCAVVACAFALLAALAPETEYDALWYHLWLPSRWLAAGRPVDIVSEYVSLYPLTWELLFGMAMTIGGDVGAKLLHFECLLLVAITTGIFSARWYAGPSGTVAAALAITVPLIIWEGTTAYIDLALAWYVVAAAYALVRYDETRDRRWLILGALAMGIALGIKNLALVFFAILGVIFLVRELLRTGPGAAVRVALLFAVVALLVPAPWYTRAWFRSGNPVFPDLYPIFGARPPERWDTAAERELRRFKDRFGRDRSLPHLLELPWDVTMHGASYGGTLGPVFLLLVPVAVFAAAGERRTRARTLVLSAGLVAYGVVWSSPISSLQLRFLVPAVPFLAALGGEGLRRLPLAGWVLTAVLLAVNLPPLTGWHEADRRGWSGWLTHTMRLVPLPVVLGAESREAYLARKVPSFQAWQYIDSHAPSGSRVLTFSGGDHLYSRTGRIWGDAPAARAATWGAPAGTEASARAAASQLGITHVLFDKRQFGDPNFRALAISSAAMRACCLEPLYDDGRFAVYRLR